MLIARKGPCGSTLGCLLLVLASMLGAQSAWAKQAAYAIAIGNNKPAATDTASPPLRYADDDAARFHELFSRFARRTELLSVLDPTTQSRFPKLGSKARAPTLTQLRIVLQEYREQLLADAQRGEEPVLYISFSGHGALQPSGEYALAFLDGGLTQHLLYDELLPLFEGVQVHIIVDSCHAAGVVGVKGPFDQEQDAKTVELGDSQRGMLLESQSLSRFPNVGAIVASSATGESHEWSRLESGVFSHEIISGLLGAADVNGDFRIEYSELQAFVSAANRSLPSSAAKPVIVASAPATNQHAALIDVLSLRDSTLLTGITDETGHFYVESSAGQRLLDAHFERSQRVLLALPRVSSHFYLRSETREARVASEPIAHLDQLHFTALEATPRGSVEDALRHGLFASAYGASYYRGFVDSQSLLSVEFGPARPIPTFADPVPTGMGRNNLAKDLGAARLPPLKERPQLQRSPPLWVAGGFAVASGVALTASAIFGAIALERKKEFDETEKQRPAHDLAEQYANFGHASLACAALGVGAGLGAFLTWPRARLTPVSPSQGVGLGLAYRTEF